jgi:hypothetical protein
MARIPDHAEEGHHAAGVRAGDLGGGLLDGDRLRADPVARAGASGDRRDQRHLGVVAERGRRGGEGAVEREADARQEGAQGGVEGGHPGGERGEVGPGRQLEGFLGEARGLPGGGEVQDGQAHRGILSRRSGKESPTRRGTSRG